MSDSAGAVILVEDDAPLRAAAAQTLELAGFEVRAFSRAEAAIDLVRGGIEGVIVSDVRLPRIDGFELLRLVRAADPELPVILVTGHGDVPMAVAALKDGAFDFLTKPFAAEHLISAVRRATEHRRLIVENRRLRAAAQASEAESPMVGISQVAARLRRSIGMLAETDLDVLIEGETGTGKDLAALLIHRGGRRRSRPYVAVDCGALTYDLAEAELFGHAADSVPHTRSSRVGRIRESSGGTLLLDGIEDMPLELQGRLLRVLEEREVRAIGESDVDVVTLRVLATSSVDLAAAVAAGTFRADLYHRLALTRLFLPPLRSRREDVPVLFARFLEEACARLHRSHPRIDDARRHHLLKHAWPGNVRELRNYAFDSVMSDDDPAPQASHDRIDLREHVAKFESALIADALAASGGSVSKALSRLGIPRKTLYEKMAKHGIDPSSFR